MKAPATTVCVHDVQDKEVNSSSHDGDSLTGDNAALAALGYKQEFKRSFTPVEVFGIGFSIIGLFPSIA